MAETNLSNKTMLKGMKGSAPKYHIDNSDPGRTWRASPVQGWRIEQKQKPRRDRDAIQQHEDQKNQERKSESYKRGYVPGEYEQILRRVDLWNNAYIGWKTNQTGLRRLAEIGVDQVAGE